MKKQWIAFLVCLLLAVGLMAGCAAPVEQPAPEEPTAQTQAAQQTQAAPEEPAAEETADASAGGVTVTDMLGREVTVAKADKVVSLTPAGTEIICQLACAKRLVGIDAFSNYPEITQNIEVVGDYNGPDVEKIVALEPDVIFAGNTLQSDAIDQLETLGMTVVCAEATTWEEIPASIELIGKVLDMEDQVAFTLEDFDAAVNKAKAAAPAEQPTVYYAMSYGDAGNWTSGPASFINTMIEIVGGKCVTESAEYPWVEYPLEDLLVADPDIVLVDASMGSADGLAEAVGYKDLTAVKNGNVYAIDADVFTRPGPRLAEAVLQLSDILNGTAA